MTQAQKEHSVKLAKTAGYTHMVRYTTKHEDYGILEKEFCTTDDAIKIYQRSLAAQEQRGTILSFEIVPL